MRLIDADTLIDTLKMSKYIIYNANATLEIIQNNEIERCISFIEDAPTIERPHGEWIKECLQIDERPFRSFAKCKVCGCGFKPYSFAVKEFDFCPKCGSDMRKERG